jgi:hypothetical protein
MDFAFVPGITPYEQLLQLAMQYRDPKTTLINKNGIATVVDFLNELISQNLKGGDLVLGAHASRSDFVMPFDPTTPQRVDYEKMEALSAAGTVHIPNGVRGPDTSVHLKGCRIGDTARPLLSLIKTALNNPKNVTAPKYLHSLHNDADLGIIEFMKYAFEVTTTDTKNFDKRDDLVAAFQSPPKPFLQGVEKGQAQTEVPKANFRKWIPSQAQLDSLSDKVNMPISVNLNPPVLRLNPVTGKNKLTVLNGTVGFDAFPDVIPWPIDMTGRTVPPDKAGRIALLKSLLQPDPKWKFPPAHPFPYYVRYGFDDFDTFFAAFAWDVTLEVDGSKQTLKYTGTRFIYRVEVPVVKKGTTDLIYNYYPKSGKPVVNFREDNAKFEMFGIV